MKESTVKHTQMDMFEEIDILIEESIVRVAYVRNFEEGVYGYQVYWHGYAQSDWYWSYQELFEDYPEYNNCPIDPRGLW